MKKYFISGPRFTGEIVLVYADTLQSIDFSQTDMPAAQIMWVLARLPPDQAGFAAFGPAFPSLNILDEEIDIEFEVWWKAYNKKVNKERALKQWNKLNKSERVAAWIGLRKYQRHLKKNPWKNKASADKYIIDKYWNNEFD